MLYATQPYIITSRQIEWGQQKVSQREEHLHLYQDKVICASHEFTITEVHDMSYRLLSANYGFFYLHTIRGVFSYIVTTSPHQFIDAYKQIK
ncbi:hypothetical protein [Bacillus sp. REN10]|uniref:hypothetical protein n=1 Tax=Bacillus sp. REN10 TaxID=2782541 RepID=UPI00193B0340|nr:hypothetical protein [Bacillus sp. REN10]